MPSASSETFPAENENDLCDFLDTAVTKKPCSLEISRGPSTRTGKMFSVFYFVADAFYYFVILRY